MESQRGHYTNVVERWHCVGTESNQNQSKNRACNGFRSFAGRYRTKCDRSHCIGQIAVNTLDGLCEFCRYQSGGQRCGHRGLGEHFLVLRMRVVYGVLFTVCMCRHLKRLCCGKPSIWNWWRSWWQILTAVIQRYTIQLEEGMFISFRKNWTCFAIVGIAIFQFRRH